MSSMILKSPFEKRKKANIKPKKPDKNEKIKLITYQNFLFTLGKIKWLEKVISPKEKSMIAREVKRLKNTVALCFKSGFKK